MKQNQKKNNNMEIYLKRIARKSTYTIGRLYINGTYFCDTLEPYDRLYFGLPKVWGSTAIPQGRYEILLNNYSPKFGNKEPYKYLCNGCVPLINNVNDFSGVRIHIGNESKDTDGCPLVGENKVVGKVINSKVTFTRLMNEHLNPAKQRKEKVFITIQ